MSLLGYVAGAGWLGTVALAIAVYVYRRRASRAAADRDQALADLGTARAAEARQEDAKHVDSTTFDRYQKAVEAMVARHRDLLGGEYHELVRTFDAAAAPAVPQPGAAEPAAGA